MKRLMDSIEETARGRIAKAGLNPVENEIRKYILSEFARNGRAPVYREIVDGLKLSSAEMVHQTIEKLERADILKTKEDVIISAYPFSAKETHHKVIFEEGHEVYALCATDAIGTHFMLNKDLTVLSKCPQCEGEMSILLRNGSISSHKPEGIVEFVCSKQRCGCTAETLCPFINFFCSMQHLEVWREENQEYRNGEIISLTEALQHSKTIFSDFLE